MSSHRYAARPSRPSLPALALDLGFRVRIEAHPSQRSIFSGAEDFLAQDLVSELAEMVASLRVHSFALRAELEQVTSALMVNVECGFLSLADRAALDLGGLFASAGKHRLADPEFAVRSASAAFRIADLFVREVR